MGLWLGGGEKGILLLISHRLILCTWFLCSNWKLLHQYMWTSFPTSLTQSVMKLFEYLKMWYPTRICFRKVNTLNWLSGECLSPHLVEKRINQIENLDQHACLTHSPFTHDQHAYSPKQNRIAWLLSTHKCAVTKWQSCLFEWFLCLLTKFTMFYHVSHVYRMPLMLCHNVISLYF